MSTLTVCVCEDTEDMQDRIPRVFEDDHGKIEFVTTCQTMSELIASADDGYDVLLIDDRVPWKSGDELKPNGVKAVAAVTAERGRKKPARVLWTSDAGPLRVYAFMAYGGHNYVNKNPDHVIPRTLQAIRETVHDGARWPTTPPPFEDQQHEKLVRRSRRLLALLAEGWRDKQIAEQLGYQEGSIRTRKTELASIFGITSHGGNYGHYLPARAQELGYYWVPFEEWVHDPKDVALWPEEEAAGLR
jgi:DNA-binding NarL/FixJ family response regulator